MDSVDNILPFEFYPYKCVGIVGTYKSRSIKKIKYFLKQMGFKPFSILDLGHPLLIGVLLGGDIAMTTKEMMDFWIQTIGPASINTFRCGQPVEKQLTKCGLVVKSYTVLENYHGVLAKHFRKSSKIRGECAGFQQESGSGHNGDWKRSSGGGVGIVRDTRGRGTNGIQKEKTEGAQSLITQ